MRKWIESNVGEEWRIWLDMVGTKVGIFCFDINRYQKPLNEKTTLLYLNENRQMKRRQIIIKLATLEKFFRSLQ